MASWLAIALRAEVVVRSLKVSAIVGTVLVGINQGGAVLSGTFAPELFWKIPMTYFVPYLVSTYASVSAISAQERS